MFANFKNPLSSQRGSFSGGIVQNNIVRGIILGGSLGLIASWTGVEPLRAVLLGMIFGVLAVMTRVALEKRKKSDK